MVPPARTLSDCGAFATVWRTAQAECGRTLVRLHDQSPQSDLTLPQSSEGRPIMFKPLLVAALVASFAMADIALAQDESLATVVVTGARLRDYDAAVIPHVVLRRRANHVITTVRVSCDTREKDRRIAEMKDTLRALMRRANAAGIALATNEDDIVRDLNETMFDDLIRPDTRPDSSYATVVLKTPVSDRDTFESATERLKRLIEGAEKVGRTEIGRATGWDLTLVGPEQNRDALIKRIVEDSRHTAGLLGAPNGISIEGLQRPIEWYRSGPLELALYIPYRLEISPK
jgi:hypothetical protein